MSTPPKGDPARGWQAIEAMIARDEAEWLETATEEEIERRMAAEGVKLSKVPSADEFLARVKERARAASLRQSAFAAFEAKQWDIGRARLDEAAAIDPAGEEDSRVLAARKAIAEGRRFP